jgi:hypothetical protein
MAAGLLAVPSLIGAALVLAALCRAHSPRLAWLGAGFMTAGMVGLGAAHGYELAAFGLASAGDQANAIVVLSAASLGLAGVVFLALFLGGAVLGTLTLAAAAWRSPWVPRIVPICLLAFAVLDFVVAQVIVSHLVNLLGFTLLAGAVVVGYGRNPAP